MAKILSWPANGMRVARPVTIPTKPDGIAPWVHLDTIISSAVRTPFLPQERLNATIADLGREFGHDAVVDSLYRMIDCYDAECESLKAQIAESES